MLRRLIMLNQNIRTRLFHMNLTLLPQMNEIYELELAFWNHSCSTKQTW